MLPKTNKNSLFARDRIKANANEEKEAYQTRKMLGISEGERTILLENLKSTFRDKHRRQEFVHSKKILAADASIIRGFGEEMKGGKLTLEEFRSLKGIFYGEEIKEKIEIPELEEENYKIDQHLSLEEKMDSLWGIEAEMTANVNGKEILIHVLKKEITGALPNAFVWEYLNYDAMPKELVGQQIFNRNAVVNLGLENKLPSFEQMEKIRGGKKNHGKFLKNNFQKKGETLFPGSYDPEDNKFYNIGNRAYFWLAKGDGIEISKLDMGNTTIYYTYAFSVRLRKAK